MFARFLLMMILLATLAPLSALAAPAPAGQRILLINKPKLWSAPRADAATHLLALASGKRVAVLETKAAPDGEVSTTATWYQVQAGAASGWLPDAYLAPPPQAIDSAALGKIGTEPVDRFHGIPPEYKPADLTPVTPLYDKEVKSQLRQEAAQAFQRMVAAARRDGVRLQVVSGYRSWTKQQELYEKRVRENMAQNTVAKPGHSEHQLGTAVDLTDGDENNLLKTGFGETPAGRWLHDHAPAYGFAISFTLHNQPQTGCAPEPWHYRYWGEALAPVKHREALGATVE